MGPPAANRPFMRPPRATNRGSSASPEPSTPYSGGPNGGSSPYSPKIKTPLPLGMRLFRTVREYGMAKLISAAISTCLLLSVFMVTTPRPLPPYHPAHPALPTTSKSLRAKPPGLYAIAISNYAATLHSLFDIGSCSSSSSNSSSSNVC